MKSGSFSAFQCQTFANRPPEGLAGHTAYAQEYDGDSKHDDVHGQQSEPEMDFAILHGIAQEGQSVLVNQEKPDGDEDVVGVAAARIEIGKRHGKQTEQEDTDGQRDAPHQFRLMLRIAAADKLGCRDGAAVGNGVDEFGRGAYAKEVIYMIDDIQGVARSETMISMEEAINDKRRLLHKAFREL